MKEFDEWLKSNFVKLGRNQWVSRFYNPLISTRPEILTTKEVLNKYKETKEK